MRVERRGELHRHVTLVGTASELPAMKADMTASAADLAGSGLSLLRLSVPARLLMVAVAAALLWTAVLWALR
jgi:hypothetical protein